MVIREIVAMLLEWIASFVGLEGIAIGALATAVVGLYYLREMAGVFVLLARYARVLSLILAALLVVLVGGTATGAIELDGIGPIVESIASYLGLTN
ncbi:hypothetical protein [Halomicrobium salinisoli]|uniref:hypothetical protein n=1 Tax=Halomicrobium salinisoli TaxID=2878391 RepID=UPI001CF038E1|nr:hypothetical protein [Halomicrobium salinisoli]